MKTNSIIALILSISLFGLFGCADKYEVDYEAPVKIEFAGVDQNNRVSLTKGIAEYTATIKVQGEIMSFEIYQADSKTGMQRKHLQPDRKWCRWNLSWRQRLGKRSQSHSHRMV